jgi:hypothetical protein
MSEVIFTAQSVIYENKDRIVSPPLRNCIRKLPQKLYSLSGRKCAKRKKMRNDQIGVFLFLNSVAGFETIYFHTGIPYTNSLQIIRTVSGR